MKAIIKTSYRGAIIAVAMLGSAYADNTLNYSKLENGAPTGAAQKVLIRQGKIRIDLPDGKNAVIYNSVEDKIYILQLAEKTYMTMDPAMMDKMMGALTGLQAQMESQLASMPEEQRAQMRAMMSKMAGGILGGGKAPVINFKETGRQEKVGDYQTKVIEVTEDGKKTAVYYVVDRQKLNLGDAEYATMQKLQAFLDKLMKNLPAALKQKMKIPNLLAKGNQLPVKTERYESATLKESNQLTGISSESLEASLFEIPEGFQKRQMPTGMGAK
ncbi:MAG: hypothetical protein L3J39_10230 [Verrucomicrobiales bacterium]|nr:hypothetical protein [Verrucomicrobiales bacterium]